LRSQRIDIGIDGGCHGNNSCKKLTKSGDMPISTPALLLAAMTGAPP
jgi:hypothetical protein